MKIFVRTKPGAKVARIERIDDTLFASGREAHFVVAVKEPPIEGRANDAVRKALAYYFGVAPSRIRLVAGVASRNKIFEMAG